MEEELFDLIREISTYEVDEEQYRRSCCTAWDLCTHTVKMHVPQHLWLKLKEILSAEKEN